MGNCNHRKYIPELLKMVKMRMLDPASILTQVEPLISALDAYKSLDKRRARMDQGGAQAGRRTRMIAKA